MKEGGANKAEIKVKSRFFGENVHRQEKSDHPRRQSVQKRCPQKTENGQLRSG